MFISDIYELATLLHMEYKDITYILYKIKTNNCYHSFVIPKKNGDKREIYAPNKILSNVQRKISRLLFKRLTDVYQKNNIINKVSHGFFKEKSIFTNAKIHKNKKLVINIDLNNFFDSFHFGRVRGYFLKNKYFQMSNDVSLIIAKLCCFNGKLPQGAPSSPIITNLICQTMDNRIIKLCTKYKLDYTRYVDDLSFSTNDKSFNKNNFLQELDELISNFGFSINNKKTRFHDKNHKQKVTGLIVNKKVNIDKQYYKETKSMALSLYTTGAFTIDENLGTLNQLEGRFAFINQVNKFNNKNVKPKYLTNLNSKEKQYQLFLFYKIFISNHKPVIFTEGKTDILYIKAALMANYKKYPSLITLNKVTKTFSYKVSFLNKNKILDFFFGITRDGGSAAKQIYDVYVNSNNKFGCYNKLKKYGTISQNPFIILLDNEPKTNNKPLKSFLNHINFEKYENEHDFKLKNFLKIKNCTNLYLITNPLVKNKLECEIEDLFSEDTLKTEIDGKSFSRTGGETFYGKEIFSKYIYKKYKEIDFSNFLPLLDNFVEIIKNFNSSSLE